MDPRPLADLLQAWDDIAQCWGLTDGERGWLLPAGLEGPIWDVDSWRAEAAEGRIRLLVRLASHLSEVHPEPAKARAWLGRPNAALGGLPPLEAMSQSVTWIEWLANCLEAAS